MIESDLVNELFQSTIQNRNKLALAVNNNSLTYSQLWQSICSISYKLDGLGIVAGDRILFSLDNTLDFIILHFAILKLGAISVPLDTMISETNLDSIIKDVNPATVIANKNFGEKILTNPEIFIEASSFLSNYDLDNEKELESYIYKHNHSQNLAVILFTSGSTGTPKGVMLSHSNTIQTIRNIINFCSYDKKCTELVTLPLTHSFGLGQVYAMLFSGGSAFLETGMLRMKRIFKAMDDYDITGFPTTPKGVDLIINRYAELFQEKGKDLKTIIVNSAPLMPHQTKQLQTILPNSKIYVYYGLTEASRSSFACLTDLGPDMYSTVGQAMDFVDISIDDDNGEIFISGPTVSTGYWPDDFFKISEKKYPIIPTGDIGFFDEYRNLYITGRIKDQINIGGYKVDPFEVEKIVKGFDQIKELAVVGSDINNEEQVIYFIVPYDFEEFKNSDLKEFCRGKIEHYKMPKKIILLEKLPEGVNGKIDRKALKELINNN
jgi:long-chain acyl-CoA synthetase